MIRTIRTLVIVAAAGLLVSPRDAQAGGSERRAPAILKKGQRIAIVGDSITEQKLYSRYLELYFEACLPELDLRVIQLGWGGETAGGFANRMNNDLISWKPDVVTLCYGMNDGGYKPFEDSTGARFRGSMTDIVARIRKAGGVPIIGSSGPVDTHYFRNGGEPARMYNATLGHLRDIGHALADHEQLPFANLLDPMMAAMEASKKTLGDAYDVCGHDGVHPGPNGHLLMAYAFLKALGVDGEIGVLELDAARGTATATEGHRVLSADKGKLEVESTRYPFCFFGDEKSSGGTRSILPYVPFNQDLNRFILRVKGLEAPKASVSWGAAKRSFSRAELEQGINLAEAFLENPFSETFRKLDGLVWAKQNFETSMIKQSITFFPTLYDASGKDKDLEGTLETLRKELLGIDQKKHQAVVEARVPIRHTLTVTPE